MSTAVLDANLMKMTAVGSQRSWRGGIGVVLLLTAHLTAFASDDPPNRYPEKGKVIAARITEHTEYGPIFPADSKGRTQGGQAFIYRKWVYRLQTDDGFYELQGGKNPSMAAGDRVEFRIKKGTAHVRTGNKEKKYQIVSTSHTPSSDQPAISP